MKKLLLSSLAAATLAVGSNAQVIIGSEDGSQYSTATWTNGAPGVLSTWYINSGTGAINNISDSTQNGRASIGSQAFFILGGPGSTYIDVYKGLGGSLASGQSFSLDANYSWNGGTRVIAIEEAFGAGLLFQFEHGGDDSLRFVVGSTTNTVLANAFNQALTYNVAYLNASQVAVSASLFGSGTPLFTTNLTVSAMPNQVHLYTGGYGGGTGQENYGLYFNNLTTVPEPSTYALLALGAAGMAGYVVRRRRR